MNWSNTSVVYNETSGPYKGDKKGDSPLKGSGMDSTCVNIYYSIALF